MISPSAKYHERKFCATPTGNAAREAPHGERQHDIILREATRLAISPAGLLFEFRGRLPFRCHNYSIAAEIEHRQIPYHITE